MTLTCRLAAPLSSHKLCVSAVGPFSVPYFHSFSESTTRRSAGLRSHSLLYPRYPTGCLPHTKSLKIWLEWRTTKLAPLDRNRLSQKELLQWTLKPPFSDHVHLHQPNIIRRGSQILAPYCALPWHTGTFRWAHLFCFKPHPAGDTEEAHRIYIPWVLKPPHGWEFFK